MTTAATWAILGVVIASFVGMFAAYMSTSGRIDSLRAEMSGRMDRLDTKVDSLRAEMSGRMDHLDTRIDASRSELSARIDQMGAKADRLTERVEEHLRSHHAA